MNCFDSKRKTSSENWLSSYMFRKALSHLKEHNQILNSSWLKSYHNAPIYWIMEQLNDIKLALRSTTSSNCTVTMTTHREQLVPVKPKPAHFKLIGLTILLCIVIIISVFGNSFALIAFRISRKLRSVTNYFIINLCIADLCVALLSMPFWISFLLTGWPNKKSWAVY